MRSFLYSSDHRLMHSNRISFLPFALAIVFLFLGQSLMAQYYSGLSSTMGLPYPEKDNTGIRLEKAGFDLERLDSVATYHFELQYSNPSSEYKSFSQIIPLQFYFHEFRPDIRARMLENLAAIYPDLFQVTNAFDDIQNAIRRNFGQRLFVRKFLNPADLAQLGIALDARFASERLSTQKVMVEFRWVESQEAALQGLGQVLKMELKIVQALSVGPGEKAALSARIQIPSLMSGKQHRQFYAPLNLYGAKAWEGSIGTLYIINDMLKQSLVIPRNLDLSRQQYRESKQVVIVNNFEAQQLDRVAFVSQEYPKDCQIDPVQVMLPLGVSNISATSWFEGDRQLDGTRVQINPAIWALNQVPEYEHLSGQNLQVLEKGNSLQNYEASAQERLLSEHMQNKDCSISDGVSMIDYCNPIFAFDLSSDQQTHRKTAWCESTSGRGKGEKITFTLKQPAKAIRIYNGFQISDEKYVANSRVRRFRIKSAEAGVDRTFPMSDLKIINLYQIDLNPGKYEIIIEDVFTGKHPTTCLCSIAFDFTLNDPWFQKNFDNEDAQIAPK